jgi:hypothetical protein
MNPKNSKITKKTIYIDAEEEITGVIDKLLASSESIVALVIPKRATVFSSIVNMKLLKRSADQNDKKIVLITSNKSVLPLAGIVGLHVAQNLNSKPYVPAEPSLQPSTKDQPSEESTVEVDNTSKNEDSPVLADEEIDALEVDNSPKEEEKPSKKPFLAFLGIGKDKHGTKLKVPDFNKFRLWLIIGGVALVLLIIFGYWALAIAPRATVTLRGDTSTKDLAFAIKADSAVTEADLDNKVIPAIKKEIKKTESEKVPATGQKDNGNKASGQMTLRNCSKSDGAVNIPAGTGVSSEGLTFITQQPASLKPSIFTGGGSCISETVNISVMAQQAGDRYNVSERSYSVAGFSSVQATGSTMSGGTSQIVKVVSGTDVETAKSKLAEKQVSSVEELKASLGAEGYTALEDTFSPNEGAFVPTPAVGSESADVTVSVQKTYTMIGVKTSDLKKLIEKIAFDSGIDGSKQSILNDGLTEAIFQLGATEGSFTVVNISNKITAGPKLDNEAIKQEIIGKKRGEAEQILSKRPGVKEVRIETSPFWNYSVPKNPDKINLNIQEIPNESSNP